ncbi:MAG: hypothetical protein O6848_11675 [Bacteroidetes bacterium]|nr:hypothetical protein [Bacteroidota bacterium]
MKICKVIFVLGMIPAFFSCSEPKESSILVDGSEFPTLPASAVKEPYVDQADMVKITINNSQGNITGQGDYNMGFREGTWTEFHPNGFPQFITSYVNGRKQGLWMSLDNRGQLLERAYFHEDNLHGNYIKYNRTRIKEERYYVNGALEGPLKKYYDNGNLMEESIYSGGKLNGTAKWYDTEGNVTIEYEYVNGEWINPEGEESE